MVRKIGYHEDGTSYELSDEEYGELYEAEERNRDGGNYIYNIDADGNWIYPGDIETEDEDEDE